MGHDTAILRSRLEAYRALLQRGEAVPELVDLVELLESELAPHADDSAAPERTRSHRAR